MSSGIVTKMVLSKILIGNTFENSFVNLLRMTSPITERAYKKDLPVNLGTARQDVKKFDIVDGYVVKTTAQTAKRRPYPQFLKEGTGKLKGKPDYGFTSGRVRAGDVKRGIGGIRPNWYNVRAKEKSNPDVLKKYNELIVNKLIKPQIRIARQLIR